MTPSSSSSSTELILDAQQQAAVDATESAIAVLAGPGSGKTRTLSFRARRLLKDDAKANALLLTFTNKAAAEMKARAIHAAHVPSHRLHASTFHTFCAELLRAHGALIGIQPNFEILDEEDQQSFGERVANSSGTGLNLQGWSRARLRREPPLAVAQRFGAAYERAKRQAGVVDYDDLIVYSAELLEKREDIAAAYGARFRHVLIDEFQDTNAAQFALVSALAKHVATVSIFADDDQAIFGFAGAESLHVKKFAEALGAVVYPLTTNYRSRRNIVDLANRLIRADCTASGRQMTSSKSGGAVVLSVYATLAEEAAALASDIDGVVKSGVRPSDVAVLVRAKYRADLIHDHLAAKRLPISDWREHTYASSDRRNLATCLSVIRGRLSEFQANRLCGLLKVAPTPVEDAHAFLRSHAASPGAAGLLKVMELALQGATPHVIATAAQTAVTAIEPKLGAAMGSVVAAVRDFQEFDPEFTLEHLLADLALGAAGRPPTEGGGIKLATLHRTKGLQWPHVYLVGLTEGHHPHYKASDATMSEERRLCFVGISRAEERLMVTYVKTFKGWAKAPSRFLKEMGLTV